jgi:catechol 2,3-dioxygenase-like lactoylglutathione lyase family enzyme
MQLGAFSISLTVKDLAISRAFYEKLGFATLGGDAGQGWLILKNGSTVIGLFQGMFSKNMLTFNPGWSPEATHVDPFTDVRALEAALREAGVEVQSTNTANSPAGPAHFVLVDPDGNPILIDQHR